MTALEVFIEPEAPREISEPMLPYVFVLHVAKTPIAESTIGLYRRPAYPGEEVRSVWPARFHGPLEAARAYELRTSRGAHVAGGAFDFPSLERRDRMEITMTLRARRRAT